MSTPSEPASPVYGWRPALVTTQQCFVLEDAEPHKIRGYLWGETVCGGVAYLDPRPPRHGWRNWPRHQVCEAILAEADAARSSAVTVEQP